MLIATGQHVDLVDVPVACHHPGGFDPFDPADLLLEGYGVHWSLRVTLDRVRDTPDSTFLLVGGCPTL
jgi:hypothetical protein